MVSFFSAKIVKNACCVVFAASAFLCGSQAFAGGTEVRVCNGASNKDLFVATARYFPSDKVWQTPALWRKATPDFCTSTEVLNDSAYYAFIFAELGPDGVLVPVTVDIDRNNFGEIDFSAPPVCARNDPNSYAPMYDSEDGSCEGDRLPVPVSVVIKTGETDWDETSIEIFDVYKIHRDEALSNDEEKVSASDYHTRWQGYFDTCRAQRLEQYPKFFTEQFAGWSCVCETLLIDQVIPPEDLTYEYPIPYERNEENKERIYPIGVVIGECDSKAPDVDMSKHVAGVDIKERLRALE